MAEKESADNRSATARVVASLGNSKVVVALLAIIAVFVVGVVLLELRTVLIPFSVALLLTFLFQPIVLYLKARRIPISISLVAVVLSLTLVISLVGLLVYSSAQSFTEAFDRYEARIDTILDDVQRPLERLSSSMGLDPSVSDISQLVQSDAIQNILASGVGSVVNLLSNVFLVMLFMLFLLAGSGELETKIWKAYPPQVAGRIAGLMANISREVRSYLAAKALVSALTGILIFLILWILGVDFPVFWGFLAFLLNFIPNIGSMVAVILPFLLSLLQFESLTVPIIALVLMQVVQTAVGNVVDPRVMAFSLDLSPVLILVSLIFWGWLWGIPGMVLAVPLTATIKIFCENIEGLRPVAVLMGSVSKRDGRRKRLA